MEWNGVCLFCDVNGINSQRPKTGCTQAACIVCIDSMEWNETLCWSYLKRRARGRIQESPERTFPQQTCNCCGCKFILSEGKQFGLAPVSPAGVGLLPDACPRPVKLNSDVSFFKVPFSLSSRQLDYSRMTHEQGHSHLSMSQMSLIWFHYSSYLQIYRWHFWKIEWLSSLN